MLFIRTATLLKCTVNVARKKPILAIFDVTKQCNQHCPMCNIPKNNSTQMSPAEIRELASRLRKFGIGYVFIQGGEPLMRKDIVSVIDAFIENGIKPTIITNGVFLTKELAEKLKKRKCNVAISVDSLNAERYKFLRGSDDLSTVVENVKNISPVRKNKSNWSITTTVSKKSEFEDVKAIYDFATAHGFMHAIRPYVSVLGVAGKYCESLQYDEEEIVGIFEHFLSKARKENYLASLVYKYHIKYIKGEKMPPCDALRYSFYVSEAGQISPCIEYPDTKIQLSDFNNCKANCRKLLQDCNETHPCFYNDAREIGIILHSLPDIIIHLPKIISQLIKYGNFF